MPAIEDQKEVGELEQYGVPDGADGVLAETPAATDAPTVTADAGESDQPSETASPFSEDLVNRAAHYGWSPDRLKENFASEQSLSDFLKISERAAAMAARQPREDPVVREPAGPAQKEEKKPAFSFDEFVIGDVPEEMEPKDAVNLVKGLQQHFRDQLTKFAEHSAGRFDSLSNDLRGALQHTAFLQTQEAARAMDAMVVEHGKDYTDVLGDGKFFDLPQEHKQARIAVDDYMALQLRQLSGLPGNVPRPSVKTLFRRAPVDLFGEKNGQALAATNSNSRRSAQGVHTPSDRRVSEKKADEDPDAVALRFLNKGLRDMGHDPGPDELPGERMAKSEGRYL